MQPLLQQQPENPEQIQEQPVAANDEEFGGAPSDGEFTIDSDQIESGIKQQLDEKQNKALVRILDAGNKLLFDKSTHYQAMEGLTDEDDTKLADELGKGGISIANMLFQKSGGTMPQELIIPAGVILLARVAEFLHQTGHKINDDIFHNAIMMFDSGLKQSADPEYHNKIKQAMGEGDQGNPPEDGASPLEDQPMPQQSQPQQPAGLLGA